MSGEPLRTSQRAARACYDAVCAWNDESLAELQTRMRAIMDRCVAPSVLSAGDRDLILEHVAAWFDAHEDSVGDGHEAAENVRRMKADFDAYKTPSADEIKRARLEGYGLAIKQMSSITERERELLLDDYANVLGMTEREA